MRAGKQQRSEFSVAAKSRRQLLKATPLFVAEPLEARRLLSGTVTLPATLTGSNAAATLAELPAATQQAILSSSAFVQQAKLTAADGAANDNLGDSVAISGNTMVVGVPHANANTGAVYVFTQSGANWSQAAKLTASSGVAGDDFGTSVAISGSTVLVGAPYVTYGGYTNHGAAYVFTEPVAGWTNMNQPVELLAADGHKNDYFGYSVALSGGTAVIGAYGQNPVGNKGQGAAYVFTEPGAGWGGPPNPISKLTAVGGAAQDNFGDAVAIDGANVVIGAPHVAVSGNAGQGAAYLFTEPGGGWLGSLNQTSTFTAADGKANDNFGDAVAISGTTLLVGAGNATISGNGSQGAAYVFTLSGMGLNQVAKLTAGSGAAADHFGATVAISGNTALVGAFNATISGNSGQGAAYVFTEPGGGWANMTETTKLTADDGAAGDDFGQAVALGGYTAVVGAPHATIGANAQQGAACAFASGVNPTITVTPPSGQTAVLAANTTFTLGSFTQANATAPFSVDIIWGDGSPDSILSMALAGTIPATAHTYTAVGFDTASITVSDAVGDISNPATFGVTVAPSPTTTTVTSSNGSATYGQAVTFTATVTPANGSGETGTVQFQCDGGNHLGSAVALSGNTATYTTAVLPIGSYAIVAVYSGDGNFTTSTSPTYTQTVVPIATTTALTCDNNPVAYGQAVTFTATVTPANGSGEAGTVQFQSDGGNLGDPVILTGNTASYTTSALVGGNHTIVAVYSGDGDFSGSTSPTCTLDVAPTTTTTTIINGGDTTTYGLPVSFTARVLPVSGPEGPEATGTVQFTCDGGNLGSPVALHDTFATYAIAALDAGSHFIAAVYSGDGNFAPSSSDAASLTINRATTATTLPVPPANIIADGTTEVTNWVQATITGVRGAPAPSGPPTYTYYSGNAATGVPLASSPTTFGIYTVVANYAGDNNYLPSTSAAATFTIQALNPTVTVVPPPDQVALVGGNQSFRLGSFTQTYAFAPYTVDVNWGDLSPDTIFTVYIPGKIPAATHTYAEITGDGNQTVTVTVTDATLRASGNATFTVNVTTPDVSKVATLSELVYGQPVEGNLICDPAGNVYGTSWPVLPNPDSPPPIEPNGGAGKGMVFEVAAGSHALTTLTTFGNSSNFGFGPDSLCIDALGNLYGTTYCNYQTPWDVPPGHTSMLVGPGSVFEIPAGSGAISTLAWFPPLSHTAPNACYPLDGPPIFDAAGNLYGLTSCDDGAVYELAAGTNTITPLAYFDTINSGSHPWGLIGDASGNLYGLAFSGGINQCGTLFKIAAGNHTLTTAVTFNGTNGSGPEGQLVADAAGNLYGFTWTAGTGGGGTVFEYSPANDTFTTLVSFNGTNGRVPSNLVIDAAGNLYGTCSSAEPFHNQIFRIDAVTHTLTTLATFDDTYGLDTSQGSFVADPAGNLYGITYVPNSWDYEVYEVTNTGFVPFAPKVNAVWTSAPTGARYKAGDTVPIMVNFSKPVTVVSTPLGTPQLAINDGGSANYISGSGTSTLIFNYVVGTGENTADLDYASMGGLSISDKSGSSIQDAVGNDAMLTLAATGSSQLAKQGIIIDTTRPTVSRVSSTVRPDATYGVGASIPIDITFSEPVTVTGTPQLWLNNGAVVDYSGGNGTATLTFKYVVANGQSTPDLDYSNPGALAGGSIQDLAGNPGVLTLPAPAFDGLAAQVIAIGSIAGTTTVVSSSADTVNYAQPVTFTATVIPDSGIGETGTVQFQIDGGNVGSPVALGDNTTSYTTSQLSVGSHAVDAVYSGDDSFVGSTSDTFTQNVATSPTTTVVTSSSNCVGAGQAITFTAAVTPANGNGETGTVQFVIDGGNVGNAIALSGNTATYTTSALTAGQHAIAAIYSGDGNFATSTSAAFTQNIAPAWINPGGNAIWNVNTHTLTVSGSSIINCDPGKFGIAPNIVFSNGLSGQVVANDVFNQLTVDTQLADGGDGDTLVHIGSVSGNGTVTVTGTNVLVAGIFSPAALVNNGAVEIDGNGTIGNLTGSGNLTIGNGTSANTVQLTAAATSGILSGLRNTQTALTISSGSTLDITNNVLLLDYDSGSSPLEAVTNAVAWGSGYGTNTNGAIISSTVNVGPVGKYAVGYADHTEISTVPTGNVEVAYTLNGDANVDGSVDILDYQQMAPHYDEAGVYDWSQGDFNHDGHVDILDYQAMAPNYDSKLTAGTLAGADTLTSQAAGIVAATVTAQTGGSAAAAATSVTTATPVSKKSLSAAAATPAPAAAEQTIADSAVGADELYLGVSYQPVFAD